MSFSVIMLAAFNSILTEGVKAAPHAILEFERKQCSSLRNVRGALAHFVFRAVRDRTRPPPSLIGEVGALSSRTIRGSYRSQEPENSKCPVRHASKALNEQ
jgi:hypothetical protein